METNTLSIEYVPLDDLQPDPLNPRRMSDEEQASLRRSMRVHGFAQPVLARRADHRVIGGHQRVVAARSEGLTTVPVIFLDVTVEQARLLGLALNRISGSWDDQLLARMLAELDALPGVDLVDTGFDPDEIGQLLRSLETHERRDRPERFDVDAAVEAAGRTTRSSLGDRWRLGANDLLVGDATDPTAIERLLDGRRPMMAFTDPPYNVGMGDHGGQGRGSRRRRMTNDVLDPAAWELFARGWARTLLDATDGALYVFMSCKEWPTVSRLLAEAGGHWSTTIIWSKDRFTLGRADYQRAYEPIWYGWRDGVDHYWCGDRDQSDVWAIPRPAESPLHPVMKPLGLMERAMTNSSRPGDLVLDPFVGSGSTIIAAERTGRRCAAMEIDPVYADVAIARWESFTGTTAERIDE
jgi:DNA modification methylase